MNKTMNNWSQQELVAWIDTLSSISEKGKATIIRGINEFKATGGDVFDVFADDLEENLEISAMLARKLFKAIDAQRNTEFKFKSNPSGYISSTADTTEDDTFSVNLTGVKGSFCTIDKLKSSYTVEYLKQQYLDYYGRDFKDREEFDKITIRRMKTILEGDKTLAHYNIVDDTITLMVTFRVNGGSDVNNTNPIVFEDSHSNQIGSVHPQHGGDEEPIRMDVDSGNAETENKQLSIDQNDELTQQAQMDIDDTSSDDVKMDDLDTSRKEQITTASDDSPTETTVSMDDSNDTGKSICENVSIYQQWSEALNQTQKSDPETLKIYKRPKDDKSDDGHPNNDHDTACVLSTNNSSQDAPIPENVNSNELEAQTSETDVVNDNKNTIVTDTETESDDTSTNRSQTATINSNVEKTLPVITKQSAHHSSIAISNDAHKVSDTQIGINTNKQTQMDIDDTSADDVKMDDLDTSRKEQITTASDDSPTETTVSMDDSNNTAKYIESENVCENVSTDQQWSEALNQTQKSDPDTLKIYKRPKYDESDDGSPNNDHDTAFALSTNDSSQDAPIPENINSNESDRSSNELEAQTSEADVVNDTSTNPSQTATINSNVEKTLPVITKQSVHCSSIAISNDIHQVSNTQLNRNNVPETIAETLQTTMINTDETQMNANQSVNDNPIKDNVCKVSDADTENETETQIVFDSVSETCTNEPLTITISTNTDESVSSSITQRNHHDHKEDSAVIPLMIAEPMDVYNILCAQQSFMDRVVSQFGGMSGQCGAILMDLCKVIYWQYLGYPYVQQYEIDEDIETEARDLFTRHTESTDTGENEEDTDTNKTFKDIPMHQWGIRHVKEWIQSLGGPFPNKCDKFKNINGKQLLGTNSDDLSFFLSSKMQRRKFMQHLEKAKKEYNTYTQDDSESNRKCIIGLNNLGNTCFMNTCIQLLSQTPRLARYLANRAINLRLNGDSIHKRISRRHSLMLDAWTQLCDVMYNNKHHIRSFSPQQIRNALHRIDNDFGVGEQDDSARALSVMLNALDEDIENEMNTCNTKHTRRELKYIDFKEMTEDKALDTAEEQMFVDDLLRKHNPQNSIIRNLFDGVERVIYTCYNKQCGFKYRQYRIFRMLQLPVYSNKVTFLNITVVNKDKYIRLSRVTVLDYCSIDVLKHAVIQNVKCVKNRNALNIDVADVGDIENIDIINMKHDGDVEFVSSLTTVSELQACAVNIFAIIKNRNEYQGHSSKVNILRFVMDHTKKSICYTSYDEDKIDEYVSTEIIKYPQSQYKYVFKYNGVLINDPLMVYTAKECATKDSNYMLMAVHMMGKPVVTMNRKEKQYSGYLKRTNHGGKSKSHEKDDATNETVVFALGQQVECLIYNKWHPGTIESINERNDLVYVAYPGGYGEFIESSGFNRIRTQTPYPQMQKGSIDKDFKHLFRSFATRSEGPRELDELTDCLKEYQHEITVDESRFSYKCRGCGQQCKVLKLEKDIIETPQILTLHLDRFGKNMNTKGTRKKRSYCASNKFNHAVRYEATLNIGNSDKHYELYGVSNHSKRRFNYNLYAISKHSGTTSFGHYTANVKCLTDGSWYNVSDSHVDPCNNGCKGNSRAATILMYSGI